MTVEERGFTDKENTARNMYDKKEGVDGGERKKIGSQRHDLRQCSRGRKMRHPLFIMDIPVQGLSNSL